MYEIEFSRKASKFLTSLLEDDFQAIDKKLQLLKDNPYRRDLDICKLAGRKDSYRLRIGKFRILYTILKEKILIYVFDAGYRGGVYK